METNLNPILDPLTSAPETDDAANALIEQLATSLAPESCPSLPRIQTLKTALLGMHKCRRALGRPVSGAYDDVLGFFLQTALANSGAD